MERQRSKLEYALAIALAIGLFLSGTVTGLVASPDIPEEYSGGAPTDDKTYFQGGWIICEGGKLWSDEFQTRWPYNPPTGVHTLIFDVRGGWGRAFMCNGTKLTKL